MSHYFHNTSILTMEKSWIELNLITTSLLMQNKKRLKALHQHSTNVWIELCYCSLIILNYTARQSLRIDNTIIHSNHKMKGNKMWKIRISAGYSKMNNAYANFFSTSVHHLIAFIRALKVLTRVDSYSFKSKFYRNDLIDELEIFGMSST